MTSQFDLEQEVKETVEDLVDQGQVVKTDWVTQSIVKQHAGITGDDAEWYQLCAFGHIRYLVRQRLRLFKVTLEDPDDQVVLPGFDRLQNAYLTERDGDHVVVPIGQLTVNEIREKIGELRRMGDGCHRHADELERYLSDAQGVAVQRSRASRAERDRPTIQSLSH